MPKVQGNQGIRPVAFNNQPETTVLMHMMRRAVVWEYLSRNPFLDSQGGVLASDRENVPK